MENRDQLPPEKNRSFTRMCDYCLYCENLVKIFPKKHQASLLSFPEPLVAKLGVKEKNSEKFIESLKFGNSDKIKNIKLLSDYL